MLGLPRAYDVDPAAVQRAFLQGAARIHPDLVAGGADPEAEGAAILNRAKRVLDDPEQRAIALLRLLAPDGAVDERTLPPGFLAEMMDVREQIEAAQTGRDRAALDRWERWAQEQRTSYRAAVGELFSAAAAAPDPGVFRRIRQTLNAWRYIERLIEQIDPDAAPRM